VDGDGGPGRSKAGSGKARRWPVRVDADDLEAHDGGRCGSGQTTSRQGGGSRGQRPANTTTKAVAN
jgi:hypothetical protein